VARKVWPGAGRLYHAFLNGPSQGAPDAEPQPGRIERLFGQATQRRVRGRAGLRMQSRFPRPGHEGTVTAAPYGVLEGFADLFPGFTDWLARATGATVHGHLFAPDRAWFADDAPLFAGALSDHAALRDHDPEGFLANLIWNRRGERQCFLYGPADLPAAGALFARDRNARVWVISGAWAVPLFRRGGEFAAIRAEAARLQAAEARHLDVLMAARSGALIRVWPLAEFIEDPMAGLRPMVEALAPAATAGLQQVPQMADLTGFAAFLQRLRNDGMNPYLVGDFPAAPDGAQDGGQGGGLPRPSRATG